MCRSRDRYKHIAVGIDFESINQIQSERILYSKGESSHGYSPRPKSDVRQTIVLLASNYRHTAMPRRGFGLPAVPTATNDHVTTIIIFEYIWTINDMSKQTATYTTTYINTPSHHNPYALARHEHMRLASQTQVVAVPVMTAPSGGIYTCDKSATIATRSQTASSSLHSENGRHARETSLASAVMPSTLAAAKIEQVHSNIPLIALPTGLLACQVVLVWLLFSAVRVKRQTFSSWRRGIRSSKNRLDA